MTRGGRLALVFVGGVAVCAAAAGLWGAVMDMRSRRISDLLARLPRRLSQWAAPIAYGAVRTVPADFPATDGDAQLSWAKFGAALMDRESQGGDADTYVPGVDLWNGEGDGGHAVTPWQFDKRYHGKYLGRAGRTPESDSEYAFSLLAARWKEARARTDSDALALAATAAAYNADQHKVWAALDAGGGLSQIDALTTGKDYGADVLRRYGGFA